MDVIFYHKTPNILLTKVIMTSKQQLTETCLPKLFINSVCFITVTIYYCWACLQISLYKIVLVRHLILRVHFTAFILRSATAPAVAGIPGPRFHNLELDRSVMMVSLYNNSTVLNHYTVDTLQRTVIDLRLKTQVETLGTLTIYNRNLHCYFLLWAFKLPR